MRSSRHRLLVTPPPPSPTPSRHPAALRHRPNHINTDRTAADRTAADRAAAHRTAGNRTAADRRSPRPPIARCTSTAACRGTARRNRWRKGKNSSSTTGPNTLRPARGRFDRRVRHQSGMATCIPGQHRCMWSFGVEIFGMIALWIALTRTRPAFPPTHGPLACNGPSLMNPTTGHVAFGTRNAPAPCSDEAPPLTSEARAPSRGGASVSVGVTESKPR